MGLRDWWSFEFFVFGLCYLEGFIRLYAVQYISNIVYIHLTSGLYCSAFYGLYSTGHLIAYSKRFQQCIVSQEHRAATQQKKFFFWSKDRGICTCWTDLGVMIVGYMNKVDWTWHLDLWTGVDLCPKLLLHSRLPHNCLILFNLNCYCNSYWSLLYFSIVMFGKRSERYFCDWYCFWFLI